MAKAHKGVVVTLAYVQAITNRYGQVYYYFRRDGRRYPLPGEPGTPEFMLAYNAQLAGLKVQQRPLRSPAGTASQAIGEYYTDNSFLALAPGTRKARRQILERFRSDFGDLPLAGFDRTELALLLGKKKPFAARNWLKALRGLMAFAVATGLRENDPTDGVRPVKAKAGTIHTWTEDEIAVFEAHYPIGTRPRLAMGLMLYTAARRGDAIKLGRQNLRNGRIIYRQQKTRRTLEIPLHPQLAAIINATPSENLTFLLTEHGKPYTVDGFGNWFRKICRAAGLRQCSAHGLRKACSRRLAEAGCSVKEIQAITGHTTLTEVARYTAAADQIALAEQAISRTRLATRPKPSGNT